MNREAPSERYLSLWVALCIVGGIALGRLLGPVQAIGRMEVARVNLPVGLLIWVMIIPMLLKIDFGALHEVRQPLARHRRHAVRQLGRQAVLDGAAGLDLHPPVSSRPGCRRPARQLHRRPDPAGRGAPCTAMVFVWSRLTNGHPLFTLSQVALNDTIMVFAFAPSSHCCWACRRSPCPGDAADLGGAVHRDPGADRAGVAQGAAGAASPRSTRALARIGPWSIAALLATLVLLFAFQGRAIPSSRWSSRCWRCPS